MKKSIIVVIIIVVLSLMAYIFSDKTSQQPSKEEQIAEIENLVSSDAESAKQKSKEYIDKYPYEVEGYLEYAKILETQGQLQEAYNFLNTDSTKVNLKQEIQDKKLELSTKIYEKDKQEKEEEKKKSIPNEEEQSQQQQQQIIEDERYDNLDALLSSLYPYGHNIHLIDGMKKLNDTTYMGIIDIENEYGNKQKDVEYTAEFTVDNKVKMLMVNNIVVFEQ